MQDKIADLWAAVYFINSSFCIYYMSIRYMFDRRHALVVAIAYNTLSLRGFLKSLENLTRFLAERRIRRAERATFQIRSCYPLVKNIIDIRKTT